MYLHIKPFFSGGVHRLDFVILLRVVSLYSFVRQFYIVQVQQEALIIWGEMDTIVPKTFAEVSEPFVEVFLNCLSISLSVLSPPTHSYACRNTCLSCRDSLKTCQTQEFSISKVAAISHMLRSQHRLCQF